MRDQGGHGKAVLAEIPDGKRAILTAGGHNMQLSWVFVHTQQCPVVIRPAMPIADQSYQDPITCTLSNQAISLPRSTPTHSSLLANHLRTSMAMKNC